MESVGEWIDGYRACTYVLFEFDTEEMILKNITIAHICTSRSLDKNIGV